MAHSIALPTESGFQRSVDAQSGLPSRGEEPSLLGSWGFTPARPFSRGERIVALLLAVSLHAGVASAAYLTRDAKGPPRRTTKVEIELSRPPIVPRETPPKPLEPPPPAKPVIRQERPAPPPPRPEAPAVAAVQPVQPPPDTGSSSPSSEDGELFSGSGGLGTAAPAPPAPPAPAVPAAPALVVQAREGANYARNPRPAYPGRAKREGWQGTVLLRVHVQPSGRPGAVTLQRSSGREILDEAAMDAVKNWTFVPASQGGSPVAGYVTVPIVFRLQ